MGPRRRPAALGGVAAGDGCSVRGGGCDFCSPAARSRSPGSRAEGLQPAAGPAVQPDSCPQAGKWPALPVPCAPAAAGEGSAEKGSKAAAPAAWGRLSQSSAQAGGDVEACWLSQSDSATK